MLTYPAGLASPFGYSSSSNVAGLTVPNYRSFSIPGAFTPILEEQEGLTRSRSSSLTLQRSRTPVLERNAAGSSAKPTLPPRPTGQQRTKMYPTEPALGTGGGLDLVTPLSPGSFLAGERSPTVASIANEREANMRTPRPNNTTASASTPTVAAPPTNLVDSMPNARARIQRWRQERDASEGTIEATPTADGPTARQQASLGHSSVRSSLYAMGASESGVGLRVSGDLSPHQLESSTATSSAARRARKVAPPELLVVVRPPPSKQANPLNLQIQLVTPGQGGAASGRVSGEVSRDEGPSSSNTNLSTLSSTGNLRRSNSVSSSRSAISEASSTGLSAVSASSGGRRVTPLYNLNFHTITPTTVNDAGTDQKVARFSKKGVEIDGFGLLTPQELLLGVNDLASIDRRRRSSQLVGLPPSLSVGSGSEANVEGDVRSEFSHARSVETSTVASDRDGVLAGNGTAARDREPPTSFDAMSPQAKDPSADPIANIGGRLLRGFKRLSINAPASPARNALSIRSAATTDTAASSAPSSLIARVRGVTSKGKGSDMSLTSASEDAASSNVGSQESNQSDSDNVPQLVVGAGLRSDGARKTQGYFWTVKRWNRRAGDQNAGQMDDAVPGRHEAGQNPILNSVWKRFNVANRMGGHEIHPPASTIPVRFEWTRAEVRKTSNAPSGGHSATSRHSRPATDAAAGASGSLRASLEARSPKTTDGSDVGAGESRRSPDSIQRNGEALQPMTSHTGSRPSSLYGGGSGAGRSSTQSPYRRSTDRSSATGDGGDESDPEDSETKWACHLVLGPMTRIPIGSMAPTPHHPKLIAQLTVPYPLPDLSQSGLGVDGAGLTREELKDIISVTALFVIVREAFGGLAKRRKGDSALKFGAAVAQR